MYKLLIVDDEPIALDGVLNCVDQTRLKIDQIYTASCVLEAKAIFKDNTVDILICDIEMPGENGFVLAGLVKKLSEHSNSFSYLLCKIRLCKKSFRARKFYLSPETGNSPSSYNRACPNHRIS